MFFSIPAEVPIQAYPETEGTWQGPKPWDWDYRKKAHEEWLRQQNLARANDPNAATLSSGSEPYKPATKQGEQVYGPFSSGAGQVSYQKNTSSKKPEEEEDWMNQLLMSALMAKPPRGTYGPQSDLAGGVGASKPYGDPWLMRNFMVRV